MSDVGKNYVIALVEWHQVLNLLFSMSATTLPIQGYGLYKKNPLAYVCNSPSLWKHWNFNWNIFVYVWYLTKFAFSVLIGNPGRQKPWAPFS
jgi:hypothetical protein